VTARARLVDYLCLAAGLWLAWVLLFQWAGAEALSPPGLTLRRAAAYLASEQFWPHAAATGLAFAYGSIIALCGGLALGFALGAHRTAGQVGAPILSSLYSIPKITLYPVILLVFGLGISAKVAFGALHGIFPVALFTIGALRNMSPVLIKTARVLRLDPLATARTGAAAGGAAGDRHRPAHRLLGDAARNADRRAVRVRSRSRLHADPRHGGAQGGRHHGADAIAVRVRRDRQCPAALGRAARAPAAVKQIRSIDADAEDG
jgi:hypothetical protein